jgi:two-component system, NarL family, response regulator DevR
MSLVGQNHGFSLSTADPRSQGRRSITSRDDSPRGPIFEVFGPYRPGRSVWSGYVIMTAMTDSETTNEIITVFLLDDHEVVRQGVRDLLEASGEIKVIGEASTAAEAMSRIPAVRPNVAVLDVRLPDGNGVEVCREILNNYPDIACLMLTSYSDDEALFEAIMAGAAGYVLKQIRGTDLVAAVKQVATGASLLDPSLTGRVLARLRNPPQEDERLSRLSEQERRILSLIAEGMTNRQIANELHLAEKTIKNYVSTMLMKLGMERRTEAAVFAARLNDDHNPRTDGGT